MFIAYLAITALTVLANAVIAALDFLRSPFVLANSAAVGVPESWLPLLGGLKSFGAVGLVMGLFGFHELALSAAAGLSLFYVGAITVHIRARILRTIAFPAAFLGMALTCLMFEAERFA
ncbi:DoxX family protein [Streptomyces sp. WMMC897]|uniref:DoxX family protein n=1 Tax=Streptomyces sp. WMMC897 TaxID=3014782 RepID=UPI0022B7158E|nr:DoxX family protein [Streptomyces sp. WMMC897]MCZ7414582.1 DoxX family protein [Streptomyces sp. WMMC897]